MTLNEYLVERRAEGLTEERFAVLVGLSQPQVNRLRRGTAKPSWEALRRIHDATGGLVTAADFLPAPATENTTEAA